MFKNMMSNLIVGLVLYVGYILAAKHFLGLEYNFIFKVVAFIYGAIYVLSMGFLDGEKYVERKRFKSVLVTLLSIAGISCVLVVIILNQKDICQVPWLMQLLTVFVGAIISGLFLPVSSFFSSSNYYVVKKSVSEYRQEVEDMVDLTIVEVIGVERSEIYYDSDLRNDLDIDDLDFIDILLCMEELLYQRCGYTFDSLKMICPSEFFTLKRYVRIFTLWNEKNISIDDFIAQSGVFIHKVRDLIDIMSEALCCIETYKGKIASPFTQSRIRSIVISKLKHLLEIELKRRF